MTWKNKPTAFSMKIEADTSDRLKKITGDMLSGVVISSPVDTGQFRSNHRVSVNSPDNGYDQSTDPQGMSTIARGNAAVMPARLGDTVYIQNNLPYAERIEHGWSQQSPSGVYGITFASVSEKYRKW